MFWLHSLIESNTELKKNEEITFKIPDSSYYSTYCQWQHLPFTVLPSFGEYVYLSSVFLIESKQLSPAPLLKAESNRRWSPLCQVLNASKEGDSMQSLVKLPLSACACWLVFSLPRQKTYLHFYFLGNSFTCKSFW